MTSTPWVIYHKLKPIYIPAITDIQVMTTSYKNDLLVTYVFEDEWFILTSFLQINIIILTS